MFITLIHKHMMEKLSSGITISLKYQPHRAFYINHYICCQYLLLKSWSKGYSRMLTRWAADIYAYMQNLNVQPNHTRFLFKFFIFSITLIKIWFFIKNPQSNNGNPFLQIFREVKAKKKKKGRRFMLRVKRGKKITENRHLFLAITRIPFLFFLVKALRSRASAGYHLRHR